MLRSWNKVPSSSSIIDSENHLKQLISAVSSCFITSRCYRVPITFTVWIRVWWLKWIAYWLIGQWQVVFINYQSYSVRWRYLAMWIAFRFKSVYSCFVGSCLIHSTAVCFAFLKFYITVCIQEWYCIFIQLFIVFLPNSCLIYW